GHRAAADVLVARRGPLQPGRQVHPELEAVEQPAPHDDLLRRRLDVEDPATISIFFLFAGQPTKEEANMAVRAAVYRRMSHGMDDEDWKERQLEDGLNIAERMGGTV